MALYPESAERAVELFSRLHVPDMTGQPTMADVCREWVFDFVRSVFGGLNPETGEQEIREYLLLIPKKNSKSTISAGIMLVALILHERQNDELLLLSATRETANTTFSIAAGMVRADPDLSAVFHVRDHLKSIEHRVNDNVLKVVSLDSNSLAGKRASYVLVDELWLLGGIARAESALQEAMGGMASRKEGWALYLTTQSDEPPAGVFRDKLQYARQVRDGEVDDPSFLPVLYELPTGVDYSRDIERAFELTNPNLDASVSRRWLLAEYRKVEHKQDGGLQRFLAKHLNVEIGLALRTDRWAGADYWQSNETPLTLDSLIDRSEVVTIGVDGGGLDDLLGLYVVGRESGTGRKLGWAHAWCAKIALQRREQLAPTLRGFEQDGDLTIVPTVGPDIEQLAAMCAKVQASRKLYQIGCDPAGIGQIVEAIQNAGVPEDKIIGISQGWKLGSAISTAERWLADGSFIPADQGLMRWAVGNARVEPRANSILITKQASGRGKIDPLMALFDATAIMALNPEPMTKKLALFSL
ncbi:terminase [Salinisphaera orenii MK-B5]|uniref:Terminase n=1 Tax=Salinisphaera orenii MK-B5 TaxID=856730 RepID=A0A423PY07_9GAMM|nr:terminase [Salinisphaera orenii MK-B5]